MKRALLGCLLAAVAIHALAHRLDEYLQAIRVSVATNRVDFFVDLTPGVAILKPLMAIIDRDRDGQVSNDEATTYARRVLEDLRIQLDHTSLALTLATNSFPALDEVREGRGTIRIKASAPILPLAVGQHTLDLTNAHLPLISVYLVNALAPRDENIRIVGQTRDELQKEYHLKFSVQPSSP